MQLTPAFGDYELLDTGDFEKLERFGRFVTRRPEPQAIWRRSLPEAEWRRADASFRRDGRSEERGEWRLAPGMPDRWTVEYAGRGMRLRMRLALTSFKHVGIFPEQAANWDWARAQIQSAGWPVRVLNLFAYTGGATMACAAAGAQVCHCDAAKGMVQWARENRECSGLPEDRVRWIIDDALKFVQREARRGRFYDGILMDPPSYGRGPGGEVWKLENELYGLAKACSEALSDDPLFFLINGYTTGFQASVLGNMIDMTVKPRFGGVITADEVCLPVTAGGVLPCGASGRWQRA